MLLIPIMTAGFSARLGNFLHHNLIKEVFMTRQKKKTLRWHPAFFAGIQIELQEDAHRLEFIQEHALGSEPVRADVLIIRKTDDGALHKNIGKIFRKYNIIEYKSPGDYLSIDAFYKACGYASLYKAVTGKADEVKITEITLTLVCSHYPAKLMRHLAEMGRYQITEPSPGIYIVTGAVIPIQIVLTQRLSEKENRWLKSLTDQLTKTKEINRLLEAYEPKKNDPLYRTVMDVIVRANWKKFKEVQADMCDALMELMEDELKKEYDKGRSEGWNAGRTEGWSAGRSEGWSAGRSEEQLNGIRTLVQSLQKFKVSKDKASDQLVEHYALTREQAEHYVDQYWEQEKG